jgi:hypothetical protein
MNREFSHQGDVQVMEMTSLPEGVKAIAKMPVALGEHSGHQHVITGDYEMYEKDGWFFAAVGTDGATLQHVHESNFAGYDTDKIMPKADHGAIELAPNKVFKVGIHKRYNPVTKIFDKVRD